MTIEKSMELLGKLKAEMESVKEVGVTPIQRLKDNLSLVSGALAELKKMVLDLGFVSVEEEIEFFKLVKPKFYSELVYATEVFGFEKDRPVLPGGYIEYCNQQLVFISRFFRQHEMLYQYYRLGAVEMDSIYFLRGANLNGVMGLGVPELDPTFCTAGDYLFSKFLAYERMECWVKSELQAPINGVVAEQVRSKKGRELRWTGDASNLIEILYGVFETRQFNGGEVDIADLVDVFEQLFHVNLSNYFQRFAKIKQRKLVSKTKFLDEMVVAVAKRIDDADAFVPSWAK
ncbi:RteC domain-containing protein [Pedobacter planticolens]|nr:RteC domain-containing protein [Pedobacter planticolens]